MAQQLDAETAQILRDAEAFLFDVFGTVVDWEGSVARLLAAHYDGPLECTSPFPSSSFFPLFASRLLRNDAS